MSPPSLPAIRELQQNPLGWLVGAWVFSNALTAILFPRATAVALTLTGVITILISVVQKRLPPLPRGPFVAALFIIILIAGLSIMWSVAPNETLRRLPRVSLLLLWGVLALGAIRLATPRIARLTMTFTAIAFTVALTVTAIEIYFDFAIYRQITAVLSRTGAATAINGNILNQPATLIALYLWPVSLALWLRRYRSSSVLLIAIAVAIFLPSEAQSVSLALILGILAAIFATAFPHASKITLSLLIVVGMALMPVIPQVLQSVFEGREELIATSALHRLEIWNYVVSKIFSEPALGYGLEASRILGEGTRSAIAPSSTLLPLHPHNGFLQIWLELGLSGYLALGLLCLWLVHKVTQQKGAKMVFSTGLLVSGLSLFSTAFGMWQSWLIALEFASAGALLLTLKLEAKPSATGH